jgi:hypothetical protein
VVFVVILSLGAIVLPHQACSIPVHTPNLSPIPYRPVSLFNHPTPLFNRCCLIVVLSRFSDDGLARFYPIRQPQFAAAVTLPHYALPFLPVY